MTDRFTPEKLYTKLQQVANAAGKKHFDSTPCQSISLSLRPDKKVPRAKFSPDPLRPGGHLAHPTTLRALRKDIFAAGDELFEDLEDIVQCVGCSRQLDRQFWIFCPHCETAFDT